MNATLILIICIGIFTLLAAIAAIAIILNTIQIEAMEEYEHDEQEDVAQIPKHPFKFMEWRLPIINRIVKAEFLRDMLVFTVIDRNKDEGVEVGWWSNGEWFFLNKSESECEAFRRLMLIIMKRYAVRIGRLQKYLTKINK